MARGTGAQRLITFEVHSRSIIDAPRAEHASNNDDYTSAAAADGDDDNDEGDGEDNHMCD